MSMPLWPTAKQIKAACLAALLLIIPGTAIYADEFVQASAAIQISSMVSDGKYTLKEIARLARENNFRVVFLTDRDFMRWEYGLWPLRRIIRKTVQTKSISTYGIGRYLRDIDNLQIANPDLVFIPGTESAPFYYWTGNPFANNLKIYNWHKHMLVLGLGKESDYRNLPSVANGLSMASFFSFKTFLNLWAALILVIGIFYLRKKKRRYSWALLIIGGLFLCNNFPFLDFKYDQYHGDKGAGPYQALIDYANKKGGLTFWAHPEAEYVEKAGRVSIETKRHSTDLIWARDYTGFCIFYEGYNEVGRPGGLWDDLLKEYCEAKRKTPVWAIGGLGFDDTGNLGGAMKDLRNILLVRDFSRKEILQALKEGRVYSIRGDGAFTLDDFKVKDSLTDAEAGLGQEVGIQGKPSIRISGSFRDGRAVALKINLIRNGNVIQSFEVTAPFKIDYQDDYRGDGAKFYYRLEIIYPNSCLISNPIFVRLSLRASPKERGVS